jgi:hypothetical protein
MQPRKEKSSSNIFVDTDAIVALVQANDSNHGKALKFQKLIDKNKIKIYTSSFVIGEVVTVLGQKSNINLASKVGREMLSGGIEVFCVSRPEMELALEKFSQQASKNSRFTDMVNMVLMNKLKIDTIFSFDKHYPQNGYKLLG